VIYADDKKCTIKTNKGVPMCFDLCEVDFLWEILLQWY
jgi:hypothetical protein